MGFNTRTSDSDVKDQTYKRLGELYEMFAGFVDRGCIRVAGLPAERVLENMLSISEKHNHRMVYYAFEEDGELRRRQEKLHANNPNIIWIAGDIDSGLDREDVENIDLFDIDLSYVPSENAAKLYARWINSARSPGVVGAKITFSCRGWTKGVADTRRMIKEWLEPLKLLHLEVQKYRQQGRQPMLCVYVILAPYKPVFVDEDECKRFRREEACVEFGQKQLGRTVDRSNPKERLLAFAYGVEYGAELGDLVDAMKLTNGEFATLYGCNTASNIWQMIERDGRLQSGSRSAVRKAVRCYIQKGETGE